MLHTYPVFSISTDVLSKNESNAYWKENALGFINKGTNAVKIGELKLMPGESHEIGAEGTGCILFKESIKFDTVSSETSTPQNGLEQGNYLIVKKTSFLYFEEIEVLLKKCQA